MSVNKVILIGRAGKDPDVRTLDGGAKVASLSFATTDKAYTLQNGTQVPERTEWHNLIFWNKTAEIVEKYVHKGDKLYIEGKLRTRNYDDSKGIKRYITEVFVDRVSRCLHRKFSNRLLLCLHHCQCNSLHRDSNNKYSSLHISNSHINRYHRLMIYHSKIWQKLF